MTASRRSFRDPSGFLLSTGEGVFRFVYRRGMPDLELFLASVQGKKLMEAGKVVASQMLDREKLAQSSHSGSLYELAADGTVAAVIEHERLPFPSFPYEWSPAMLFAAAALTLEIAGDLLGEGIGIKDATPFNILFRGPDPVFVDLLSFERRQAPDPIWLPHAQYMRSFFLPLLVNREFGIPLGQLFMLKRDGVEPEEVYRICGGVRRLLPPFLTKVSLPVWLSGLKKSGDAGLYARRELQDPEKARFILEVLFRGLKKDLKGVEPRGSGNSSWSGYMGSNSYSDEHFRKKCDFVAAALAEFSPSSVLDVGCNTGYFSAMAARSGARVTAIDYDPAVVDQVFHMASRERLDILPLVVNLGQPSPAVGWLNREYPSFIERGEGGFDMVVMLAVVHHLLVTDQIPLDAVIDLAARLSTDALVVEFVSPQDEMFRRIARGRDHLYRDLTRESFEASCLRHFELLGSMHVDGTQRWTYLMRKKGGASTGSSRGGSAE